MQAFHFCSLGVAFSCGRSSLWRGYSGENDGRRRCYRRSFPLLRLSALTGRFHTFNFPKTTSTFAQCRAYGADVSRLPRDGHRFAEFNWGGMTFSSKGVVYDEIDEVGLAYGHQSPDWKRRMGSTDLTCGGDGPVGEVPELVNLNETTSVTQLMSCTLAG